MNKPDLIELAKERGVDIDPRAKKAVIAEALGVELDDEPAATADPKQPEIPEGYVKVRVLPLGAGKVSTGGNNGMERAEKGAFLVAEKSVAEAQEKRGFVEIV
jgi:hypothetical protein